MLGERRQLGCAHRQFVGRQRRITPLERQGRDAPLQARRQQLVLDRGQVQGEFEPRRLAPRRLIHLVLDHGLMEIAVRKPVDRERHQPRVCEPPLKLAQAFVVPQAAGGGSAQPQADPQRRGGADELLDGASVLLQISAGLVEIRARMDVRAIAQSKCHGVGKPGRWPIMSGRKHFPPDAGDTKTSGKDTRSENGNPGRTRRGF